MPKKSYYVASDAMGNATAILDENGNVLERRSYEAFGEMTCMTPDGTTVAISPTEVDVGFQGQIRNVINGLYQMGYRWHNPTLGRWLNRDPIRLHGGINLTIFCNNAPQINSDPTGLLVEAVLDTKNNTLTVTDLDTKQTVTAKAFTGGEVQNDGKIACKEPGQKPAPKGTYLIVDQPNPKRTNTDWFGLFKDDALVNDYTTDEDWSSRSGIRLHLGSLSKGCVTVNERENGGKTNWEKIKSLIKSTKKSKLSFSEREYLPIPRRETTLYGTLTVK